jgi:hypothetical protein
VQLHHLVAAYLLELQHVSVEHFVKKSKNESSTGWEFAGRALVISIAIRPLNSLAAHVAQARRPCGYDEYKLP